MWKPNGKISDYILPMDKFGKVGKVHSVFDNSFNIKIGEQLINISNYQEYLSCFGLYLPSEHYKTIANYAETGAIVKLQKDQLIFYSTKGIKQLCINNIEPVSLQVTSLTPNFEELTAIDQILSFQDLIPQLGLVMDERLRLISEALGSGKRLDWECICHYLVGRGKGLTPSGDDLLTAYLFVLQAFGDPRAQELGQALVMNIERTTDISRNYLLSCHDGYVNSLIYQFYLTIKNQLGKKAMEAALEKITLIGHTSGKDMCYGIWLGIQSQIALFNKRTTVR